MKQSLDGPSRITSQLFWNGGKGLGLVAKWKSISRLKPLKSLEIYFFRFQIYVRAIVLITKHNHEISTRVIKNNKRYNRWNTAEWISISSTLLSPDWLKYEREITWSILAINSEIYKDCNDYWRLFGRCFWSHFKAELRSSASFFVLVRADWSKWTGAGPSIRVSTIASMILPKLSFQFTYSPLYITEKSFSM